MAGEPLWNRRLVLVTGKGGVGKTSVVAALARDAQAAGRRVLVAEISSDANAGSALMARLGHRGFKDTEPRRLESGLTGVRVTPSTGHRLFLQAALHVRVVVDAAMRSAALRRFLMAAPAFPEVGTLFQLVSLLRSDDYDHVLVDLPATGHALGLASLPRTVLKIVPGGLIGTAIREGLEIMTDPERGRAVVVTLPEAMPVSETMELTEGLRQIGVPVEALVLNRIPSDPFNDEERAALDEHLGRHDHALLLGGREFRRLERARIARQRFDREAPEDVRRIHVPELASGEARESDVVESLRVELARGSVA